MNGPQLRQGSVRVEAKSGNAFVTPGSHEVSAGIEPQPYSRKIGLENRVCYLFQPARRSDPISQEALLGPVLSRAVADGQDIFGRSAHGAWAQQIVVRVGRKRVSRIKQLECTGGQTMKGKNVPIGEETAVAISKLVIGGKRK